MSRKAARDFNPRTSMSRACCARRLPDAPRATTFRLHGEDYVVMSWQTKSATEIGKLTSSETAVLRGLLRGETYIQIAINRRRSLHTVANQVASIFRKLGVRSRRELALLYHESDAG